MGFIYPHPPRKGQGSGAELGRRALGGSPEEAPAMAQKRSSVWVWGAHPPPPSQPHPRASEASASVRHNEAQLVSGLFCYLPPTVCGAVERPHWCQ